MNKQKNGLKAMVLAAVTLILVIGSAMFPTANQRPVQEPEMLPLAVTYTPPVTATSSPLASPVAP